MSKRSEVAHSPEALARSLGLSSRTAQEWEFRYRLLEILTSLAKREGVTHATLAKRAQTSRSRITAILNGDVEHVSSDLLLRIIQALGYDVRISVRKPVRAA